MPSINDPRADAARFLQMYARLASVTLGTLVNQYSYYDIRRLIAVRGDDVAAKGDDPLASQVVDGVRALPRAGGKEVELEPSASLAALFQEHDLARALRPKLYVGFDLRNEAVVCGMLTACSFERDSALSTQRFTQEYCQRHRLPRLDAAYLLIDVVASAKPGTGALLLLNALVHAHRAKKSGVASIAVTQGGRWLFESFGFHTGHSWKEGGATRHLAHARLADVHLGAIHARLRVNQSLVEDTCLRNGLTARTSDRLIGRC